MIARQKIQKRFISAKAAWRTSCSVLLKRDRDALFSTAVIRTTEGFLASHHIATVIGHDERGHAPGGSVLRRVAAVVMLLAISVLSLL